MTFGDICSFLRDLSSHETKLHRVKVQRSKQASDFFFHSKFHVFPGVQLKYMKREVGVRDAAIHSRGKAGKGSELWYWKY